MDQVPRIVLEDASARYMKIIRGLLVIVLVQFIAFASLVVYIFGFCEIETVTVDGKDGVANYLNAGANGVINNGQGSSTEGEAQEQQTENKDTQDQG